MADEDWTVEVEVEVDRWLMSLSTADFTRAAAHIERLKTRNVLLGEPHTRQLSGKLRELRFRIARPAVRVSYFIAGGRRIVLLTVFFKTRQHERREIQRAARAMAEWEMRNRGGFGGQNN